MGALVTRDLARVLRNQWVGEAHHAPARDHALRAAAAREIVGETGTEGCVLIELGFEVLEVECEVEDVRIARTGVGRRTVVVVVALTAGAEREAAEEARADTARGAQEVASAQTSARQLALGESGEIEGVR